MTFGAVLYTLGENDYGGIIIVHIINIRAKQCILSHVWANFAHSILIWWRAYVRPILGWPIGRSRPSAGPALGGGAGGATALGPGNQGAPNSWIVKVYVEQQRSCTWRRHWSMAEFSDRAVPMKMEREALFCLLGWKGSFSLLIRIGLYLLGQLGPFSLWTSYERLSR
jgi:hypothetical protein